MSQVANLNTAKHAAEAEANAQLVQKQARLVCSAAELSTQVREFETQRHVAGSFGPACTVRSLQ